MRILIVANQNSGTFSPFVAEQASALQQAGVEVDFFGVHGHGLGGYLSNFPLLKRKISAYHPDLIHAHYGLSGLLANLQRRVPVVTTYHGSDIHSRGLNLFLSRLAIHLSAYNIFISPQLLQMAGCRRSRATILPCGVNINLFHELDKKTARRQLGWHEAAKIVLFAGAFDNAVKNAALAKQAIAQLDDVQLKELKGYSRQEMSLLFNAADCLLMTSHREGSPQVIKEAMSSGCPIVSVEVGDVATLLQGVEGCYIVPRCAHDIATAITNVLNDGQRTNGRSLIVQRGLSNEQTANRLIEIYKQQRIG